MIFGWEQGEEWGKHQHYNKLKQIRYLNVINIAECWCEIGCTLCTYEGSVIKQSWSTQFPVATFSQMALLDLWTTWCVSATCEKVGLLSPSLKFPLKEIQLRVNCCVSILNFHSPKYYIQVFIFTAFCKNVWRLS